LEARILALRKEFEAEEEETVRLVAEEQRRDQDLREERKRMAAKRKADVKPGASAIGKNGRGAK
jgi:hypothetical protein